MRRLYNVNVKIDNDANAAALQKQNGAPGAGIEMFFMRALEPA